MYDIIEVLDKKFYFKKDLNPITKEYDYHIWIRHLIEPMQAVAAYLNIEETTYNKQHDRYEAYSFEDNIMIYYFFKNNKNNQIIVISAFRKD
jgi:hypothetical protein